MVDATGRRCDNCIGQIAMVSDRSGARSLSYNELGLARREVRSIVAPLEKVEPSKGNSETYSPEVAFYEAESSYTAFGDVVQEKFLESMPTNPASKCVSAGANCLASFTIGRKYAPDGSVAELLFNGKSLIRAAQDALGRPAIRWTSSGVATGYRYDLLDMRLNQMTTLTAAHRGAVYKPIQVNGYQYDAGGNVVSYANRVISDEDYENAFAFNYDAVGRVANFDAVVRKAKQSLQSQGAYSYDQGNRITRRSLSIAGSPRINFRRDWTYTYQADPVLGPLHAPRSIAFSTGGDPARKADFGYDDIGRMTRIGSGENGQEQRVGLLTNRAMTWDAEGRMTRVRGVKDAATPDNDAWLREDYIFDFGANRTLKINHPIGDKGVGEAAIVYLTPYYARPYDGTGSVQLSLGNLPTASLTPPQDQSENPVVSFLYSDLPVGSMTASVSSFGEASNPDATVIARREYSPFGLELTVDDLAATGRDGVAAMSVFHGKELDRLTGFSSFGARYYSRDLGLWLSPDPLVSDYLKGSPNEGVYQPSNLSLYAFVGNDPLNSTDPFGQWRWGPIGAIVASGMDISAQLYKNGWHWSQVDKSQSLAAAGAGWVTGASSSLISGAIEGTGALSIVGRAGSNAIVSSTATLGQTAILNNFDRHDDSYGKSAIVGGVFGVLGSVGGDALTAGIRAVIPRPNVSPGFINFAHDFIGSNNINVTPAGVTLGQSLGVIIGGGQTFYPLERDKDSK